MSGRDYFILGSTFFMGMLVGAFLYITVYAPEYDSGVSADPVDPDAVVIEGQMYGGCMETDSCASFKLVDDRTYSYLEYPGAEIESGKVPSDLASLVFDAIGTEDFFTSTLEVSNDSCQSYVDGTDFTYEVFLGDETYTLDTCRTALANDAQLQELFLEVWKFMEDPVNTYPTIIEDGPLKLFIDRF